MEIGFYLLLGVLWIATCVLLGRYIMGIGISSKKQVTIGLKAILVSYLIGIGFLFLMVLHS